MDASLQLLFKRNFLTLSLVPSTVFKLKLKGTTVAGSNFVRMSQKTVTTSMVIIKPVSVSYIRQ